ncbi:hypothetical protein CYY_000032 [Polysphondylium violaceum]|uniref:Uncharacterized protein n=1 Tax=Polysphondylium violaceum TaxID=133409 RepID=A0A8J4UXM4_9MYCE|nr:hypothetical protein CYY_000032 [Polysphondylium violaceum]
MQNIPLPKDHICSTTGKCVYLQNFFRNFREEFKIALPIDKDIIYTPETIETSKLYHICFSKYIELIVGEIIEKGLQMNFTAKQEEAILESTKDRPELISFKATLKELKIKEAQEKAERARLLEIERIAALPPLVYVFKQTEFFPDLAKHLKNAFPQYNFEDKDITNFSLDPNPKYQILYAISSSGVRDPIVSAEKMAVIANHFPQNVIITNCWFVNGQVQISSSNNLNIYYEGRGFQPNQQNIKKLGDEFEKNFKLIESTL